MPAEGWIWLASFFAIVAGCVAFGLVYAYLRFSLIPRMRRSRSDRAVDSHSGR